MRIESWRTNGVRRRVRYHCNADRVLAHRGSLGRHVLFECVADDGRTYEISMTEEDLRAVTRAALSMKRKAGQGKGADPGA